MEELEQVANQKLQDYVSMLEAMNIEELTAEWQKTHKLGPAPDHDSNRLRNEIIYAWSKIMSNKLSKAKTANDLPGRPE